MNTYLPAWMGQSKCISIFISTRPDCNRKKKIKKKYKTAVPLLNSCMEMIHVKLIPKTALSNLKGQKQIYNRKFIFLSGIVSKRFHPSMPIMQGKQSLAYWSFEPIICKFVICTHRTTQLK